MPHTLVAMLIPMHLAETSPPLGLRESLPFCSFGLNLMALHCLHRALWAGVSGPVYRDTVPQL